MSQADQPLEERPVPDYAELHCLSSFSFLRGASQPEELVEQAIKLGYRAIAITDECSLAGVVRAHNVAHNVAKGQPIKLLIGAEFRLSDGPHCVLLARNRAGYAQLSSLITLGRRRSGKGNYSLDSSDLLQAALSDCLMLWLHGAQGQLHTDVLEQLLPKMRGRLWLGFQRFSPKGQQAELAALTALAKQHGLPITACGDVHMHVRGRRALQDTMTAIRLGKPLSQLGYALFANGERHLRPRKALAKLYPQALLEQTICIAEQCNFSLDELRYDYPHALVPAGHTATTWLRKQVEQGAQQHYPDGVPPRVQQALDHELTLIAELRFEAFFLTVHDVVCWARSQGILCQGRGSAANSAVCYCLGITSVNPDEQQLLFERFVSKERGEPPDIDVDFEHERREEVIQYIYRKYGRDHAALAATVITYRPRSAIRDVGKALGMSLDQTDRLARTLQWWDSKTELDARFREAGLPPEAPIAKRLIGLVGQLIGFPRHLSQHVGGFVISERPVRELCPLENAAMPERTIIQWDKDDLESLGLLKVDVLALGMLTALRKCLAMVGQFHGRQVTLASIPRDDAKVYDMICAADTVGVFQIESRAQMSMLPRLKPRNFYDLVIEVAIVRPGPIQGDMVHPYLNRRDGIEPETYPNDAVRAVLGRTKGIPIFQEQVMELAVVAGGFTRGEADQLRRAMAAWKRKGGLEPFEKKLKAGMQANGLSQDFADRIFEQIKGFGDYGFPESHSASFAHLAYASAWLKCHYPAAFTAALLNSLPMGFYQPAQLVNDARRHGVEVRPVDALVSDVASTLEQAPGSTGQAAIRLGFDRIKGLDAAAAARVVASRGRTPPASVQALAQQAHLSREHVEALAAAGALQSLADNRHHAAWAAAGIERPSPLHGQPQFAEAVPLLRPPTEAENIVADYASLKLTLGRHPLALLRKHLDTRRVVVASALQQKHTGDLVNVAGLVIGRQRPGTASGVVFMTLEDETGTVNLIIWPKILEQFRQPILRSSLPVIRGSLQRENGVTHVIARQVEDYSRWLGRLNTKSRDFH